MSKEGEVRRRVIEVLTSAGMNPQAVENSVGPGTPDVNYVQGWLELKQVPKWPERPESPLRIEHFTPQQRIWLRNRCRFGGLAFVLVRIDRDWLLMWGATAAEMLGYVKKAELIKNAVAFWSDRLNEQELVRCLRTTPQLNSRQQSNSSSGGGAPA